VVGAVAVTFYRSGVLVFWCSGVLVFWFLVFSWAIRLLVWRCGSGSYTC